MNSGDVTPARSGWGHVLSPDTVNLVSSPSKPGRRPTIEDVAAASGVSTGTVSRALNGKKWVSPEAQRAVEAAARQIGYRPNGHARGLKTQRAGAVAFLLGENVDAMFTDPNFASLVAGASESLDNHNIAMVLLLGGSQAEQDRALDFISSGQIDGVMLVSWHGDLKVVSRLEKANVPIIFCGTPPAELRHLSFVAADDLAGAQTMTRYLLDSGRSRVAFVSPPHEILGSRGRLDGYLEVMGDRADLDLIVEGDFTYASGRAAAAALLQQGKSFDAVFAANDLMASGVIEELQANGLSVPGDVAVAGFDDSAAALTSPVPLTTMRQPFKRITSEMSRLLVEQINGAPTAHLSVRTELIRRTSA